jgi:hypothetical protein
MKNQRALTLNVMMMMTMMMMVEELRLRGKIGVRRRAPLQKEPKIRAGAQRELYITCSEFLAR